MKISAQLPGRSSNDVKIKWHNRIRGDRRAAAKEAVKATTTTRRKTTAEATTTKRRKTTAAAAAARQKRREAQEKKRREKEAKKIKSGIGGQIEVCCSRYFSLMGKAEKETDPVTAKELKQKAELEKAAAYELHRKNNCIRDDTEDSVERAPHPLFEYLSATEGGKAIGDFASSMMGTLRYCPRGAGCGHRDAADLCLSHFHPAGRIFGKDKKIYPMNVATDNLTEPIWRPPHGGHSWFEL